MFGLNPYLYRAYQGYHTPTFGGEPPYPGNTPPHHAGEGGTSFQWEDPEEKRRARGSAFMQLGIGLLSGAGEGKFSEGLASGLQGFSQSMVEAKAAERQRQHQREQDRLQREEHDSSMQSASLNRDVVREQQGNIEEDRMRAEQARQRKAASVSGWVKDIEAELGPDSPEAKRARRYAELGEDVDVDRLEKLHVEAVDQSPEGKARRARLFQEETDLTIDRAGDLGKHGLGPEAEAARERERIQQGWAGINLQREQEARISSWGPGYGMGGPGMGMKPDQYNDNIRVETEAIYSSWLRSRFEGVGKRPEGAAHYADPVKAPPTDDEMRAARVAAEQEATRNFNERLKAAGFPTRDPGASPEPGIHHYDISTGTIRPGPAQQQPPPAAPQAGALGSPDAIAAATIARLPPAVQSRAMALRQRGIPDAEILRLLLGQQ